MEINEKLLNQYIENDEVYVFDSEEEYLDFVNTERRMFWADVHPIDFRAFEETKALGGEYLFKYQDKYYWIAFEHCLDVYK